MGFDGTDFCAALEIYLSLMGEVDARSAAGEGAAVGVELSAVGTLTNRA